MHLYAFGLYASENPWAIINTTTDNVETKLNVNKLVVWDSKDDFGNSVSAGIYLYSIKTNNFLESKKMVLLK